MQTVFSTNIRVNTRHYRADMASERSKGHRETAKIWLRKYVCEQIVVSSSTTSLKVTDNHKEPPLRTCSSPLSPLLRSDLPLDIKQEFLDRIRDATISAFLVVCMRFIILTYKIYHSQVQPSSISATRPISQICQKLEVRDWRNQRYTMLVQEPQMYTGILKGYFCDRQK
ncbi:uncharacterized protein EV154DRAFT_575606 [Mucor mucedo]|uniref:uncharacterized protein n=1 Tax=Mucor mucedo TaxID=29922 RepID=UPI002220B94C|nr:uncharacterized protein EV154DRAFT_575606 [Mucor mucedo]KAI7880811.1 hypothetical protein EV154DRAFT_575606 [Mucor mucedo]